jgi:hypothetical protein
MFCNNTRGFYRRVFKELADRGANLLLANSADAAYTFGETLHGWHPSGHSVTCPANWFKGFGDIQKQFGLSATQKDLYRRYVACRGAQLRSAMRFDY